MKVPTMEEVPASPPPKSSRNRFYQELATKAELVVPSTWWRKGFASDLLLLSHNNTDLPRKQFDSNRIRNKKLRNIYQCVTRQQFIRKTLDLTSERDTVVDAKSSEKCVAMEEPTIKLFYKIWMTQSKTYGGRLETDSKGGTTWVPLFEENGKLLLAALDVLEHFYSTIGGIWTGCFKIERSNTCRGALAGLSSSAFNDLFPAKTCL
jgi:hypothetical protein